MEVKVITNRLPLVVPVKDMVANGAGILNSVIGKTKTLAVLPHLRKLFNSEQHMHEYICISGVTLKEYGIDIGHISIDIKGGVGVGSPTHINTQTVKCEDVHLYVISTMSGTERETLKEQLPFIAKLLEVTYQRLLRELDEATYHTEKNETYVIAYGKKFIFEKKNIRILNT